MRAIIDWTANHARTTFVLMLMIAAAGIHSFRTLPREGAPNIDIPFFYVSAPYHGISAQDAEILLAKPMEQHFKEIDGLKELTTYSADGHAGALLEFDINFDKDQALSDLRVLVDRAKIDFPDGAEEPEIIEHNFVQLPIITIAIYSAGTHSHRTLFRLARELKDELESLSQVLEASLVGYRKPMLEIIVEQARLDSYGISVEEFFRAIATNNQIVAAGSLTSDTGSFPLKLAGSLSSFREVQSTVIRSRGDRVITLGDLASFKLTFEDATGVARHNGKNVVALQVSKRVGENIIDTVELIKQSVEKARRNWSPLEQQSVAVEYAIDQSTRVSGINNQLEGSVATAVTLIVILLILSLGMRSATLVGISIPLTFMLTFFLLDFFDMSISNMVLFGLILSVGMLVDGSIVVAEYAERRLEEGIDPNEAYSAAAKRMSWPIITSTLTTLSAFLPMLFWPGVPGQFMRLLPITMIFSLSMSLLVALIFMPTIGGTLTRFIRACAKKICNIGGKSPARIARLFAASTHKVKVADADPHGRPLGVFARFVSYLITSPWRLLTVLLLVVMSLATIGVQFAANNRGIEFFVETEPEIMIVEVRARGNLSLVEKDQLVAKVERRLIDLDGVRSRFAFSGEVELKGDGRRSSASDSIGQILIELSQWDERRPGKEIFEDIRNRIKDIPGVIAEISQQKDGPAQGKPIQIELYSSDWQALLQASDELSGFMKQQPMLIDVEDTRPLPGIDWSLTVDRELAGRFGADISQIGVLLQLVTRGVKVGSYRPSDSDEELDIRVRFPEEGRHLSALNSLRIATPGGLVPLSLFVKREAVPRLDRITRRDSKRLLLVRANVLSGANEVEELEKIRSWIESGNQVAQVDYAYGGQNDEQQESEQFLVGAFIGAIGLIFVILLAQFNSFFHALVIVSTVPTSIFGVMLGMLVMGQPFSIIMTGIGVVALAGVVVNNNIVLIDTYQELRGSLQPLDAIARTVNRRFRPVLLTTITTMAGMTPMIFAVSVDFASQSVVQGAPAAIWWVSLATAIVFGLGFSSILTLIFTPTMLATPHWVKRVFVRKRQIG